MMHRSHFIFEVAERKKTQSGEDTMSRRPDEHKTKRGEYKRKGIDEEEKT
jgi:hypothetical protein